MVGLLALAAFASQTAILTGGESPFRLVKWVMAGVPAFLAVGLWMVERLKARPKDLPASPGLLIVAFLPCAMAVSAAWSEAPRASLQAAGWALCVMLVLWVMTALSSEGRRKVLWAGVLGAEVSAVVGLLQAAGADPVGIVPVTQGARFRITGLAGNPADLAAGSLLAAALLIWLIKSSQDRQRWRWILLAPLLLAAGATTTLTAMVSLAALGLVAVTTLVPGRLRARGVLVAAGVLLVAAVAAWPRVEHSVGAIRSGNWYGLLSARADGWSAAAEMIAERPITGVGAAQFGCRFAPARLSWLDRGGGHGRRGELATHFEWAHCEPLQLVAELGVLGWMWLGLLLWFLSRREVRRRTLMWLTLAAVMPFALMHYPLHLACMVFPLIIVGGELCAGSIRPADRSLPALALLGIAVVVIGAVAWGVVEAGSRLAFDRWLGSAEARLSAASRLSPEAATPLLAGVEREAEARLSEGTREPGRLLRIEGRCRLGRGSPREAEEAFRAALQFCSHEEAWLGLGLSLAQQGRRGEGLHWLVRACKLNPSLAKLIPDPSLREVVRDAL